MQMRAEPVQHFTGGPLQEVSNISAGLITNAKSINPIGVCVDVVDSYNARRLG